MRTHTTANRGAGRWWRALTGAVLCGAMAGTAHPQAQLGRTLTTIAGYGTNSLGGPIYEDIPALSADLGTVQGVAMDIDGKKLYLSDATHHQVRRVDLLTGHIVTVAGTGAAGYSGDGGAATAATLRYPMGLAVDVSGNLYIADSANDVIRKVDAHGNISTYIGSPGFHRTGDAPRASAELYHPQALAFDALGKLYIADTLNGLVRKLDAASGMVTTIAGPNVTGYVDSGSPSGVAVDSEGTVYYSNGLSRVFAVSHGVITTYAGTTNIGFGGDGGPATQAQLAAPAGLAVDASGSLYIAERGNMRLRQVDGAGKIHTVAGNGSTPNYKPFLRQSAAVTSFATLASVNAVAVSPDNNSVYLGTGSATEDYGKGPNGPGSITRLASTDSINIPPGQQAAQIAVEVLADTSSVYPIFQAGNGPTEFSAGGMDCNDGNIIKAGTVCHFQIAFYPQASGRRFAQMYIVTDSAQATYGIEGFGFLSQATLFPGSMVQAGYLDRGTYTAGGYTPGGAHVFTAPSAIVFDQHGTGFIADTGANRIYSIDFNNIVSPIAGTGTAGFAGDGSLGFAAQFNQPTGLALSDAGVLYIADTQNHRVRAFNVNSGAVSTVAGDGLTTHTADGLVATSASLKTPTGLALMPNGDLLIADPGDNRVRRLDVATGLLSTVAGTGVQGYTGDGATAVAATLNAPSGVAVTRRGEIYIADTGNNVIRNIEPLNGWITTVAGSASASDANAAGVVDPAQAKLNHPQQLLADPSGGIYIADTGNNLVRYLTAPEFISGETPKLTTVAGSLTPVAHTNDSSVTFQLSTPLGLAFDNNGRMVIAENGNHDFRMYYGDEAFLNFADTAVNQQSGIQTFTLVETGGLADYTQSTVQPVVSPNDNSSVDNYFDELINTAVPNCELLSSALYQSQACSISFYFAPESAGPKPGEFNVTEIINGSQATQHIELAGTGTGVLDFTFTPDTLPDATIGVAYSQVIRVTGGTGNLSLKFFGTLPAGIQWLAPNGIGKLYGTPTEAGSFPVSIQVTDGKGVQTVAGFTLVVHPPPVLISVTEAITASDDELENLGVQVPLSEAVGVTDTVIVTPGKVTQTCTFPTIGTNAVYGAQSVLQGHCDSGLPLHYEVLSGAADISNAQVITFLAAGSLTVRLTQPGNDYWAAADPVTAIFAVQGAPLTIVANNARRGYQQPNPAFTYSVDGLIRGDVLNGVPVLSTTAVLNSPAGGYPISVQPGTVSMPNYSVSYYQTGVLTVVGNAAQTITFVAFPASIPRGLQKLTLTAHSTSGLPVSYAAAGPAVVSGDTLILTGTGPVSVTASQAGNATFKPAASVTRSFTVIP